MLIQYLIFLLHSILYVEWSSVVAIWKFVFFYGDTALETALQVQEISQKLTYPKCPRLDQLNNGSNSTIQLTYNISTSNIKIWVGQLLFGLFDLFNLMRGLDYTQNSHLFGKS